MTGNTRVDYGSWGPRPPIYNGPIQQWPGTQQYPQQGGGVQAMPEWLRAMSQGRIYTSAPAGGGLTGQQSGTSTQPGSGTYPGAQQSMSPYWGGGPFGIPSVNGSTYSQMPAYEMPNWFNNAPWDVTQWQNMTPEQLQATVAFNQQAMPWTQMAQAYQQWQNEFNQNAYQWGNEFDWKKLSDQFAMDMATRQQDTSEKQWGSEFGLKSQEQANLEKWRDTQAALEREKMATDAENQALAAWGRRMRPNPRWM